MPRDAEPPDPYLYGLVALGRRELTERQLRERLRRRHCDPAAIDAAIVRLTDARVLDDVRAARAFARTEAQVKRRGPLRILRALETMGVDTDLAREATAGGYEQRSVGDALEAALDRRLRGPIVDRPHAQRLIAYLVRQGFEVGAAVAAVTKRRTAT
ncbi:MAG: regulatory protein RecX [Luteitalea sp.]